MIYPTLAHFRHFRHSFNYNIFPDKQIMQNKPNFGNDKMNVNLDMTSKYKVFANRSHEKTKPIQSQFKPNKANFKANTNPKQSQTNPICRRAKMNAFAWIRSLTMILIMLLAKFTTPKGANSNPIYAKYGGQETCDKIPEFEHFPVYFSGLKRYNKGKMKSSGHQKLLLLISYIVVYLSTGCAFNPITGQQELMLFPEKQDLEIGKQYAPEIEKELGGKIEDEDLQNYIDSVGQKIARISHKPDWEYHYVALNDKQINAFALPGGYIFITKGMLEKLQSEAQLAAILAHETAHVVARDTSNAISNQIGIGLLLAAATSGQSSEAVMTAAEFSRRIISLRYSRQDEREADIAGLDYMVVAGYNPYGIIETMQMLEDQPKERVAEFLSSHPPPENRIAYLSQRIKTKNHNLDVLNIGKQQYSKDVLDRLITRD
jgi:Zn-dependent protease with chaperone function